MLRQILAICEFLSQKWGLCRNKLKRKTHHFLYLDPFRPNFAASNKSNHNLNYLKDEKISKIDHDSQSYHQLECYIHIVF